MVLITAVDWQVAGLVHSIKLLGFRILRVPSLLFLISFIAWDYAQMRS